MGRDDQIQEYLEAARTGDKMEQAKMSEHYSNLVQYVFEPLDRRAFETFKRVVPTEVYEIVQTQMMSKVLDMIKAEIDSLIQLGYLAKEALKSMSEEEL